MDKKTNQQKQSYDNTVTYRKLKKMLERQEPFTSFIKTKSSVLCTRNIDGNLMVVKRHSKGKFEILSTTQS